MSRTTTYAFAKLEVPAEVYDLIAEMLVAADYWHSFKPGCVLTIGKDLGPIDMHGIGLTRGPAAREIEKLKESAVVPELAEAARLALWPRPALCAPPPNWLTIVGGSVLDPSAFSASQATATVIRPEDFFRDETPGFGPRNIGELTRPTSEELLAASLEMYPCPSRSAEEPWPGFGQGLPRPVRDREAE